VVTAVNGEREGCDTLGAAVTSGSTKPVVADAQKEKVRPNTNSKSLVGI
jgi:hypothetical protein